jgi:hypothetical protein
MSTPQFLDLIGINEQGMKNAIRRYGLPFEGTRGKMRSWSEADFLLWRIFGRIRDSHGIHAVPMAKEIAAFAAKDEKAEIFVLDRAGWWKACKPTQTIREIRADYGARRVVRHAPDFFIVDISADREQYRRELRRLGLED